MAEVRLNMELNMQQSEFNIGIAIDIIADDKSLITYRPKLNKITGSVTATILLQQMLFYSKNNKNKAFYKFKEPCKHRLYKVGDSWCEELGFTKNEFDSAIEKIGIKFNKENKDIPHNKFIEYYISQDRVTYYRVNLTNIEKAISELFLNPDSSIGKLESGFTCKLESGYTKSGKTALYNTETYTENKTYDDDSKSDSLPEESKKEESTTDSPSSCFKELKDRYDVQDSQIESIKALLKLKNLNNEYVQEKIDQFKWIEKNNPKKYQSYLNKTATLIKFIEKDWNDAGYLDSKTNINSTKKTTVSWDYTKSIRIINYFAEKTGIKIELTNEFQEIILKCPLASDQIEFIIDDRIDNDKCFDLINLLKSPDLIKIHDELKRQGLKAFQEKINKNTKIKVKTI